MSPTHGDSHLLVSPHSGFDSMPEPDPFSPLLKCFERGGRPHQHHGFLHIEHDNSNKVTAHRRDCDGPDLLLNYWMDRNPGGCLDS